MAGVDAKSETGQSAAEAATMGTGVYQTEIIARAKGSVGIVTVIYPSSMIRDFGPGREIRTQVAPAQQ